jgi:EmrB/QacA subfamily drug resistance transporter
VSSGTRSNIDDTNTFPANTSREFWRMFPSVALPIYMSVGDQTIVASALPAIAGALGDVERVSWVFIGYLIASTIAAPVYGYLGDIFGRRRLLFLALAIFMIGSVLNALAPTVTLLAASRFFQGLGGGGMMSMCQALMAEVIPPRERGRYQGYTATVFVVASALGPVIGAFLTLQFGWRAVFFINIPVGILAFLLMFRLHNRRGAPRDGWRFDYRGLFYFTAFIVPLLLALEQVRRFNMSGSVVMALLVILSAISLYLLVRQQRQATSPLLPIALMKLPTIWNCQLMILCHGAMMTALIAFLPLYLRVTGIGTIHDVGFMLLVYSAAIAGSSIVVGRLVTRTGLTMIFPGWGMFFTTLMFVYIALYAQNLTLRGLYVTIAVLALAMGTVMTVCQVTIQSVAGRRQLGAASGSVQLARTVGAVFGTALFGTVLFALLAFQDPEAAASFGRILNLGPQALENFDKARRAGIMREIASGFRWGFFLLAGISTVSMALALINPTRRI